jgi:hypothetical protein
MVNVSLLISTSIFPLHSMIIFLFDLTYI